ncbi:unnamed protein product [Bursaphelenchus xylophilus]|uniref:(pine wood nematode) hypothetical protein n=1 Tax=Bursaphelenchus xylophilus TaxID=6326 RepID=A0A7I8XHD7_BURXY|nr:unnamed protein product [Bursaphelenchus xylophilus]CAG9079159.1 unnamed protein product [Bursaphelenchus xylophilus]
MNNDPCCSGSLEKKEVPNEYVFQHSEHYGIFLGAIFKSYEDLARAVLWYQAGSDTFLVKYSTYCFVAGEVPEEDSNRCRYRRLAYKCCRHPPVDRKKFTEKSRIRKISAENNCNFNFVVSYIRDIRMLRITAVTLGHDHHPNEQECRTVFENLKKRNEKKWELIQEMRLLRPFNADYSYVPSPPHQKAKAQHGRDEAAIKLDMEQNTVEPPLYSDEIEEKFLHYLNEDVEKTNEARRCKEARQQAAKLAAENEDLDTNGLKVAPRPPIRRKRRQAKEKMESDGVEDAIYINQDGRPLTQEEIDFYVRGQPPRIPEQPQYHAVEYESLYQEQIPATVMEFETFGYYPSEKRPKTNFDPQAPTTSRNWMDHEYEGSQMPTEWYQIPEATTSFGANAPRAIRNSAAGPSGNFQFYDEKIPIAQEYAPISQENRNFEIQNFQPVVVDHQPPVDLNYEQDYDCHMADYLLHMDNTENRTQHGQNQHPLEVDPSLFALQLPELGEALDHVEEHLYQLLDDEEKKSEDEENVKPKCDEFEAENVDPNCQNGRPIQGTSQGSRRVFQDQSNHQGPSRKTAESKSEGQFKRPRGRPRKNPEGPPKKLKKKVVEEPRPEFGVLDIPTRSSTCMETQFWPQRNP